MSLPPDLKAHVVRIYQTNDDGSTNTSVWVDVLRKDYMPSIKNASGQGEGRILKWKDTDNPEGANALRIVDKVKVYNPPKLAATKAA